MAIGGTTLEEARRTVRGLGENDQVPPPTPTPAPGGADFLPGGSGSSTKTKKNGFARFGTNPARTLREISGLIQQRPDLVQLDPTHWADPNTGGVFQLQRAPDNADGTPGAASLKEWSDADSKKYLHANGFSTSGGSGAFDTGPGQLDLANRKFAFETGPQFDEANRQFNAQLGQSQINSNRTELGNRATGGVSTGNLLLDLAKNQQDLTKDPENFPAWLAAMQGNTAQGPVVQNLVGQGVTITPAQNDYLNSPEFKSMLDSLVRHGTVPDAGLVGDTQNAYNANPDAAQRFFSQDPEALKRMFGTPMAAGGSFTTAGPMTFKDLSTGKNIATAGEAGPESVTVTPQNSPNMHAMSGGIGDPMSVAPGQTGATGSVSPSQGTAMALGKTLGAGGFSFIPSDTRNALLRGELPQPGQFPDWMLEKLPPSIRGLLSALVTSRLGGTGAADYNWTRGLFEQPGFAGAGGIVR